LLEAYQRSRVFPAAAEYDDSKKAKDQNFELKWSKEAV
jgi:hypothetical protein